MRAGTVPRRSAVALVAMILVGCASAPTPVAHPGPPLDPSMAQPIPTTLTGYLPAGLLDATVILGPPPAPESPQGVADRAIFEATRAMEGSPRWKAAQRDNDLWNGGALKRYACAMSREISEHATPTTLRMLERVELDVPKVSKPAKDFYNRKRPVVGNERPICVPREGWLYTNASYPSGHAATGWLWGLILAEARPDKATALIQAGREAGESRTICGVHFASDVEAGRTLGAALAARLHADPAFMADLRKAGRELARAPAPTGCDG